MRRHEGRGWRSREPQKNRGGPQTTENMVVPPGGTGAELEAPELDRTWVPQRLKQGLLAVSGARARAGSPPPGSLAHPPLPHPPSSVPLATLRWC